MKLSARVNGVDTSKTMKLPNEGCWPEKAAPTASNKLNSLKDRRRKMMIKHILDKASDLDLVSFTSVSEVHDRGRRYTANDLTDEEKIFIEQHRQEQAADEEE